MTSTPSSTARLLPPFLLCAIASACGGTDGPSSSSALPTAVELAASCPGMSAAAVAAALPVAKTTIATATLVAATATAPEHCQIDGEINRRTGSDGQSYAIRFRLRMPTSAWNGRFFMGGGGGTNGNLVDPTAQLAQGYATIGTDSGHDNTANNVPATGGTFAFGLDYQARVDFAYNAYDQVTQVGKALVEKFYQQAPKHSYFVGCSEGGREAMLMTQRFPTHYDGVVAGAPVLHLPLGPMAGMHTTQLFAGLARRGGQFFPNGDPAIVRTYSDTDLLLFRNAVLDSCDTLDGLADGIVDNLPACTHALVSAKLAEVQCTGAKGDNCLSADQIGTMKQAFAGAVNSAGTQLYSDWQWDAGIGGQNGATFSQTWRSGWIGSYSATTNNAAKLGSPPAVAVVYNTPPDVIPSSGSLTYSLNYNFDTDPIKLFATTAAYPRSSASMTFTDALDLTQFKARGGKLMVYHGGSDSTVSVKDTLRWYDAMNQQMGSKAQDFARMYVVPSMGHCGGGPGTDKFDMLPKVVDWVEKGVAPDSVVASANNPGYFGVSSRTRPLCPYPKQTRYKGSGDINDAANFTCQ